MLKKIEFVLAAVIVAANLGTVHADLPPSNESTF